MSQVDGWVGWFSTLTAIHPRARTHVGLSVRLLGLSCERSEVFGARGSDFCDFRPVRQMAKAKDASMCDCFLILKCGHDRKRFADRWRVDEAKERFRIYIVSSFR